MKNVVCPWFSRLAPSRVVPDQRAEMRIAPANPSFTDRRLHARVAAVIGGRRQSRAHPVALEFERLDRVLSALRGDPGNRLLARLRGPAQSARTAGAEVKRRDLSCREKALPGLVDHLGPQLL